MAAVLHKGCKIDMRFVVTHDIKDGEEITCQFCKYKGKYTQTSKTGHSIEGILE